MRTPMTTYDVCFGLALKSVRDNLHLSQAEMATVVGVGQPQVSKVERGGAVFTVLQLRKIANKAGTMTEAHILEEVANVVELVRKSGIEVLEPGEEAQPHHIQVATGPLQDHLTFTRAGGNDDVPTET